LKGVVYDDWLSFPLSNQGWLMGNW
jgi:hypothetical protein